MARSQRTRNIGRRASPVYVLKGRIWVEVGGEPAVNDAAADLLEQIDAAGSLSEAARRLGLSYRHAWLLLDMLNTKWPQPLVRTSIGGRQGGGAKVTELGRHVLRTYRDLQVQVEHLLDAAGDPFASQT